MTGSSSVTRGARSHVTVHVFGPWWGAEHGADQAVVSRGKRTNTLNEGVASTTSEAPIDHACNAPSVGS